jgi:F-type H+-transporting ATPase subunit b
MFESTMMHAVVQAARPVEEAARTFGVDWPHLLAQAVSFAIVCVVMRVLAYKPVLGMLEARRQQIAESLTNAERIRAQLARIEIERQNVMKKAQAEARQLIDAARVEAARVSAEESRKASAAAEQILTRAREAAEQDRARLRAELRREVGSLAVQAAEAVMGKSLTADDYRRLAEDTTRELVSSR